MEVIRLPATPEDRRSKNPPAGMADVEAKRPALEGLVRRWVELMDRDG